MNRKRLTEKQIVGVLKGEQGWRQDERYLSASRHLLCDFL